MGALRGFKDPLFHSLLLSPVTALWFPIAWTLGFGFFADWDYGIHGYWVGLRWA